VFRIILAAALLVGLTATVQAGSQCYRPAEIEAEQAVLFKTELMVLSDTCGAEQSYVSFTTRVRNALVRYQKLLMAFFHRGGNKNGEAAFDRYSTKLANEQALRTGSAPRATVCQDAATLLAKVDTLQEEDFRQIAAQRAAEHSSDYKRCGKDKK
jgi:hypothetical protein